MDQISARRSNPNLRNNAASKPSSLNEAVSGWNGWNGWNGRANHSWQHIYSMS
jgi:hypothetical protein